MTSDSVVVPLMLYRPPPCPAELPLTVQSVERGRAARVGQAAAAQRGRVSAEGAVGQRGRAVVVVVQAAAIHRGGVCR